MTARALREGARFQSECLRAGLTRDIIEEAVGRTYRILDMIDAPLLSEVDMRLSDIVELANMSSMLGNILASSIVRNCGGLFERAGPHKYQDLRAACDDSEDIEIKIALETNRPKGHLPKAGNYLTARYVLGSPEGDYTRGDRGSVIWIWEIRFGHLEAVDFSVSNTAGDSGKTAVVTTDGMKKLRLVYFDRDFCPYARIERYLRMYGN